MTKLQRSDRLKEPPVVGNWYLVPAILWQFRMPWDADSSSDEEIITKLQKAKGAKWWPVWGSKHNDVEFFNFETLHYHIDPRFLTKRHRAEASGYGDRTTLQTIQAQPLNHAKLKSGPPKPQLRRMRCSMAHSEWGYADRVTVANLNTAFAGKQCAMGKRGFVCPHKLFPLGSIEAVDGVITCPLHGLRIDAKTGSCIGAAEDVRP